MGKKRKTSFYLSEEEDNSTKIASKCLLQDQHHSTKPKHVLRQNHSEIEKRRRDKMNTHLSELSSLLLPSTSRKADKLTVLRLAVQQIRGQVNNNPEIIVSVPKPPMLTDEELKRLMLQTEEGFLFTVDSARGRLMYVSEAVNRVLNYGKEELMGQSLFDILHPRDIAKVKEQISSCEVTPRERLVDSKTMLPVNEVSFSLGPLCPGARRSFFCRMRAKVKEEVDEDKEERKSKTVDRKYVVIQCTGYLKSYAKIEEDLDSSNTCLVAIGRPLLLQQNQSSLLDFNARLTVDAKFGQVDQRATVLLGFLPQELAGTSVYEHVEGQDVTILSDWHREALKKEKEDVRSPDFRFRSKSGAFVPLRLNGRQFRNPWTKEIEYLVAKFSMHFLGDDTGNYYSNQQPLTSFANSNGSNNEMEGGLPAPSAPPMDMIGHPECPEGCGNYSSEPPPHLPRSNFNHDKTINGGDEEAAMAVVMSLLEADAGLGGSMDFSAFPWPLPL